MSAWVAAAMARAAGSAATGLSARAAAWTSAAAVSRVSRLAAAARCAGEVPGRLGSPALVGCTTHRCLSSGRGWSCREAAHCDAPAAAPQAAPLRRESPGVAASCWASWTARSAAPHRRPGLAPAAVAAADAAAGPAPAAAAPAGAAPWSPAAGHQGPGPRSEPAAHVAPAEEGRAPRAARGSRRASPGRRRLRPCLPAVARPPAKSSGTVLVRRFTFTAM